MSWANSVILQHGWQLTGTFRHAQHTEVVLNWYSFFDHLWEPWPDSGSERAYVTKLHPSLTTSVPRVALAGWWAPRLTQATTQRPNSCPRRRNSPVLSKDYI